MKREQGERGTAEPWDSRYAAGEAPTEPSALLVEMVRFFPARARVLDLACGAGRNALFLAALGHRVVALDRSLAGLRQGRELARLRGADVSWVCADLETFPLSGPAFDAILCFYYRDAKWYPRLRWALRPAGLFICETYTREQLALGEGPRNPAHLLAPGELLAAFGDWQVIFYREGRAGKRALAQLAARKPGE
jgi:SAM-dependent methyltransferase